MVRTHVYDVGYISHRLKGLGENYTMIRRIGLTEFRPLLRIISPAKCAAIHDGPTYMNSMAANEFGG